MQKSCNFSKYLPNKKIDLFSKQPVKKKDTSAVKIPQSEVAVHENKFEGNVNPRLTQAASRPILPSQGWPDLVQHKISD